ncbi:MAG: hypothetical protein OEW87_11415, partial [Flavobacteriaceae bacterium]|nr:hypothetical protein [Flavobacteriaceae bacterium]
MSCKKDPIEITPEEIIWERYPLGNNEVGLMNSSSINNQLNAYTSHLFFKNISLSSLNTNINTFRMGIYDGMGRLKFPISQNYYAFTDLNKVVIRSSYSTEKQSVEKIIDLKSLDGNFFRLIDIPYWQGECMAISENNHLLVPYRALKNNHEIPTPYFALVKIISPEITDDQLGIESVKLINQDIFPGIVNVYKIQTFFNRFFLLIGSWTYRIDTNGHIDRISESALNIFQLEHDLFAFAPNYNSGMVDFYKSSNQGESWESLGEMSEGILAELQYVLIDNKVVGYMKGQIFELDITDTNYSITELDNEGLGLADITSISLNDDNMVFITSQCNSFTDTCGAYYKPLDT